jgi:large subunit ribosomal protein L24
MNMIKTYMKKNDNIIVISGDDRGKRGKVLFIDRSKGKIVIEGINKKKEYVKNQQNPKGAMVNREFPIAISNVMLFCDKCKKGVRLVIKETDKKKIRICRKCGKSYE